MEANAQPAPLVGKAPEATAQSDRVPPTATGTTRQRIESLREQAKPRRVSPVLGYETDRYRLAAPFTKLGAS